MLRPRGVSRATGLGRPQAEPHGAAAASAPGAAPPLVTAQLTRARGSQAPCLGGRGESQVHEGAAPTAEFIYTSRTYSYVLARQAPAKLCPPWDATLGARRLLLGCEQCSRVAVFVVFLPFLRRLLHISKTFLFEEFFPSEEAERSRCG